MDTIIKQKVRKKEKRICWYKYRRILSKSIVYILSSLFLLGLAISTNYLINFVIKLDYFKLKYIEVTFSEKSQYQLGPTKEKIAKSAQVSTGVGIFALDLSRIKQNIAKNPWIEEVSIKRNLPATLEIEVLIKQTNFMLSGSSLSYLDDKGEIIDKVEVGSYIDFPVITVRPSYNKNTKSLVPVGMEVSNLFLKRGIKTSEIIVDSKIGISLISTNKFLIKLGFDNFQDKLNKYLYVYNDISKRSIAFKSIDLSFDDRVIIRKKVL